MKKFIIAGLLLGMSLPVGAEPKVKGWNTMDAMGCMLLRDCTKDVKRITSIQDIADYYPDSDYSGVAAEFNSILNSLNKIGVNVFLGDQRYFPKMHRGVYHTVGNNFFLNTRHMRKPGTLMSVMRHEGWHAAQAVSYTHLTLPTIA